MNGAHVYDLPCEIRGWLYIEVLWKEESIDHARAVQGSSACHKHVVQLIICHCRLRPLRISKHVFKSEIKILSICIVTQQSLLLVGVTMSVC